MNPIILVRAADDMTEPNIIICDDIQDAHNQLMEILSSNTTLGVNTLRKFKQRTMRNGKLCDLHTQNGYFDADVDSKNNKIYFFTENSYDDSLSISIGPLKSFQ